MDLLEVLAEQVGPILVQAIGVAFGIIVTWLGYQAKKLVGKMEKTQEIQNIKQNLENNKELVAISVEYVEQVAKNIPSEQKKELAKLKFLEFARKYGIEISQVELDTLIEQAVHSFKHGFEQAEQAEEGDVIEVEQSEALIYPKRKETHK